MRRSRRSSRTTWDTSPSCSLVAPARLGQLQQPLLQPPHLGHARAQRLQRRLVPRERELRGHALELQQRLVGDRPAARAATPAFAPAARARTPAAPPGARASPASSPRRAPPCRPPHCCCCWWRLARPAPPRGGLGARGHRRRRRGRGTGDARGPGRRGRRRRCAGGAQRRAQLHQRAGEVRGHLPHRVPAHREVSEAARRVLGEPAHGEVAVRLGRRLQRPGELHRLAHLERAVLHARAAQLAQRGLERPQRGEPAGREAVARGRALLAGRGGAQGGQAAAASPVMTGGSPTSPRATAASMALRPCSVFCTTSLREPGAGLEALDAVLDGVRHLLDVLEPEAARRALEAVHQALEGHHQVRVAALRILLEPQHLRADGLDLLARLRAEHGPDAAQHLQVHGAPTPAGPRRRRRAARGPGWSTAAAPGA